MSDKLYPQSLVNLLNEVLFQLNHKQDVLGLPFSQIFIPGNHQNMKMIRYEQALASPFGMAAGPHTQLAQNIVAGWLMGARYIELKTIQTLDELKVNKPCIDMQDEGYNCEWSQELKIEQSYNEYLNAWILIHIIMHKMNWDKNIDTIFNMSVGYDMQGILYENVQRFFNKMANCSLELNEKLNEIKVLYPDIDEVDIPSCISNNITLSTMHGCPSNEIEEISEYLIREKKLHTTIKLNPTLLGKEALIEILNKDLQYPIEVPVEAFAHDIKYDEAVKIIRNLKQLSAENDLQFAVKLTNTLEVVNKRGVLPEEMNYMSGRALHPISVALAAKLQDEFRGQLDISFSAGADAFNLVPLIKSGLFPVTVSSDLLKPGAYGRLYQYSQNISDSINSIHFDKYNDNEQAKQLVFLKEYAKNVLDNRRYKYELFESKNIKSNKSLGHFDCIEAPCMQACPTEQDIPDYLYWASKGDFNKALDVIYQKNPMPQTLGLVCEHGCQTKCTRINYDDVLRIRDIKEFIATHGIASEVSAKAYNGIDIAIIGAGPSGLSAAWFLALEGCKVKIFEKNNRAGGMPHTVIPEFRLPHIALENDIERILGIGVEIEYNHIVDETELQNLLQNHHYVYLAGGAPQSKKLNINGEQYPVIIDPLKYLSDFKQGKSKDSFLNILVVGGGNTAIDVARAAKHLQNQNGEVRIIYRRGIEQMPAEAQEIKDAIAEGVQIMELLSPVEIVREEQQYILLVQKMKLSEKTDADGRRRIEATNDKLIRIEADCIIPAIGQKSAKWPFNMNYIQNLHEYSPLIKLYIGGDAGRGASSIVQAVGDGRIFAEHIIRIEDLVINEFRSEIQIKKENREHLEQRSIRIESLYPKSLENISQKEAIEEASRCLQCDEYCNICVSVCPNRANRHYQLEPKTYFYQNIFVKGDSFRLSDEKQLKILQNNQVYNIADYCNECGNCSTFCPTSGDPYKDKPQIHLSRESFDKADRGYFYINGMMWCKNGTEITQFLFEGGKFYYEDNRIEVVLASDSLKILDVFIKEKGDYYIELNPIVEMKIFYESVFNKHHLD